MRFGNPAGPRPDFRDRNPTIIHQVTDATFSGNTSLLGFDYTVPADRSAIMDYAHIVLRLNSTIVPSGTLAVELNYVPDAGAIGSTWIMRLVHGDGPGDIHEIGVPIGHLLALDRCVVSMAHIVPTPSGIFRTTLHGIEYDA